MYSPWMSDVPTQLDHIQNYAARSYRFPVYLSLYGILVCYRWYIFEESDNMNTINIKWIYFYLGK